MYKTALESSDRLALAEYRRITREIRSIEQGGPRSTEQGMLTALRMCRLRLESELERRGWTRTAAGWRPPSAS